MPSLALRLDTLATSLHYDTMQHLAPGRQIIKPGCGAWYEQASDANLMHSMQVALPQVPYERYRMSIQTELRKSQSSKTYERPDLSLIHI